MLYIAIYVAPLKLRPYGSIQICLLLLLLLLYEAQLINEFLQFTRKM